MIFYPSKVYTYFRERFVLSKRSPKGWYGFTCQFCGKEKKAAVHLEIQYVKCWSCGAASNVAEFVQEVENCSYYEAKQLLNTIQPSDVNFEILQEVSAYDSNVVSKVTLPDGWQSILDGVGNLGDRARKYLEGRGFDLEALDFKGFGYCNKHHTDYDKDFYGYIIVPFRKDGILSYYLGRDFMGGGLRYKNPPSDWVGVGKSDVIYNEEALSLYKTIFVLEGWSDAEMLGKHATATLGWAMGRNQLNKYHKSRATKLAFIPDAGEDKQGQTFYQKAVHTAMGFLETGRQVYVVDLNPLSDKGKDVCEIGVEDVVYQYRHTAPLTLSKAMKILTQ